MSAPAAHQIPLSEAGAPCDFDAEVFPGVKGYAIQVGEEIYIPLMVCDLPGQFHKFLRLIEGYSPPVVVANVCNARLARLLTKRGWAMTRNEEYDVDEWRFPQKNAEAPTP